MRFPLTRIERIMIFAGCGIVFCGGLAFFAKLILFPGIGYGFIGSLWALGSMLISATVLGHYEAIEDMKDEAEKRGRFPILPADHPLQQINEDDPILNDRRFTQSGERSFPDREAPNPQAIDEEAGDSRFPRNQVGPSRSTLIAIAEGHGAESDARAPRLFPNGTQGPDLEFEEEPVIQHYSPVECGPLTTPLPLRHAGTRRLQRGAQAETGEAFGVFSDEAEEPTDGFEEFRAHLPLKGAEREPANATK